MNINEAAADLFAINAEIAKLTKQADVLKAQLKAHGSFNNELYKVVVNTTDRATISSTLIKEKYPTLALECTTVTPVTSVKVTKI